MTSAGGSHNPDRQQRDGNLIHDERLTGMIVDNLHGRIRARKGA